MAQQQQRDAGASSSPSPSSSPSSYQHYPPPHDAYFAEDTFGGAQATGRVYTGPFLALGFASILGCFAMSGVTKRSPNLAFKWLQRRVGAQFMTIAYFFTCNALYYHDGRRWRTRDVGMLAKRAYGPLLVDYERRRRAKEAAARVATVGDLASGGGGK